jgi:hypothetical protein
MSANSEYLTKGAGTNNSVNSAPLRIELLEVPSFLFFLYLFKSVVCLPQAGIFFRTCKLFA